MSLNDCTAEEKRETAAMTLVIADTGDACQAQKSRNRT
jgi:hypothetical protein